MKNFLKKKRLYLILTIILGLGLSLASVYFMYYYKDATLNSLTSGLISIDFQDNGQVVNLSSAVPLIDAIGIEDTTPYIFTIKNTSKVSINTNIYLDVNDSTTIPPGAVRYGLFINDKLVKKDYIHDNLILYTYEDFTPNEVLNCKLYFWVDYYYDIPSEFFSAKIMAEGESIDGFVTDYLTSSIDYIEQLNNFNVYLSNDNTTTTTTDTIVLKVSSSDERIKFDYSYTVENGDNETTTSKSNQNNVNLTFNLAKNESRNIEIAVKGATFAGNDITFEIIKNGKTVNKYNKTIYRPANDINIMGTFPSSITDNKESITKVEFKNVSQSVLESDYPIILTYSDETGLRGDVRAKLDNGILTIASEGKTYLNTGYQLFREYTNLESIDFENVDTSLVTTMSSMFYHCSKLTELNLSSFNTSNVTSMYWMFIGCSGLTELDLSSFNTNNVTNMQSMFNGCSSLTELDLGNFDTSKVTTMYSMFSGCSGLTELDLSGFDTNNVTNMQSMFNGCSSLTELNLSNFDTSLVTTMRLMFYKCSSLENLNFSSFDTTNVTTMQSMFEGCSSLEELNLRNFNTTSLKSMYEMFKDCTNLKILDLSSFDTSVMNDSTALFNSFRDCKNLTTIYASELFVINKTVTNMTYTFSGCSKLVGGKETKYSSSHRDGSYARIDNPPDSPGYFTYKEAPTKS